MTSLEEWKCITLRVKHQAVISAVIIKGLREDHEEADNNLLY